MKIAHRDFDDCVRDPAGFLQRRAEAAAAGSGPRIGYDRYVVLAIARLHKTSDEEGTRRYLQAALDRAARLTNESRKRDAVDTLMSYSRWVRGAGLLVAESMARINLDLARNLTLVGEVHRVDVTDDGYRGVMLGSFGAGWENQQRFPLLQLAVEDRYGVPVEETAVGVQDLDGSNLRVRVFDNADRQAAVDAARSLSDRLVELVP